MRIRLQSLATGTPAKCQHCGKESPLISGSLGLCSDCIRHHFDEVLPTIKQSHCKAREPFALPPYPPRAEAGKTCRICVNECSIAEGGVGYCGLRTNIEGKLKGATANLANVSWYYDLLPTNCVADWVCPGGTGAGYPDFAYRRGVERGYKNLAVFFQACSFDCLFCQNWHFRQQAGRRPWVTASKLAEAVVESTSCICFFGGDPTPQLPYAIYASRLALKKSQGHILRICWETNGSMHPALLKQMVVLSLNSGGCIKFDLKAWSDEIHIALCGISNQRTLDNFRFLAGFTKIRPSPPLLVASTLLVPGYVDKEEVAGIAAFVSSLDHDIPYTLLAFCPDFLMTDLPATFRQQANECLEAARAAGLKRVRLGNIHLLH
ncbi:MAG TPA: radical SAM protein [Dehalococcoidia bacterium]|jgi:pyruvate formate lyase activating enzyme|nr:radical SAM protein [Dehalococcoidia bacterium]